MDYPNHELDRAHELEHKKILDAHKLKPIELIRSQKCTYNTFHCDFRGLLTCVNPCKVLDYYGTCHKDFGRLIVFKIRSVAINNAKRVTIGGTNRSPIQNKIRNGFSSVKKYGHD